MLAKFSTVAFALATSALITTSASVDVPTNSSSTRELSAQAGCWMIHRDLDLVGYDYAFVREKTPEPCVGRCDTSDSCSMLTWTNWEGGRCWLKKAAGPGEQLQGTVSTGAFSLIFASPCERKDVSLGKCEMANKDADVGAQQSSSAAECYGICSAMDGCASFTWTPFNGGTCWLKNNVSECKPSATAESGVIFESS